jgi:hypothetical protein
MVRAAVVAGVIAMLPVTAACADTTSIFATAQGTSLLGIPVPVLGTQGWTVTVPVSSKVLPQFVWSGLDFTVESSVTVGNVEVLNLYLDPHMVK